MVVIIAASVWHRRRDEKKSMNLGSQRDCDVEWFNLLNTKVEKNYITESANLSERIVALLSL